MPAFSRLKSPARSLRLCPPPRHQLVMSPALRRPPVRCLPRVSGLCGRSAVISSLVSVVWKRSDGVIGLYVLIGIMKLSAVSSQLTAALQILRVLRHLLARLQPDVRFLPVGTMAGKLAAA